MSDKIALIPSLHELVKETDYEQNALMVILNQPPPKMWLKDHPHVKIKTKGKWVPLRYIPRERIEYMLTRIYGRWWVEIKDIKLIGNSPVVTIRLFVVNPITGKEEFQDGIGAAPIQTDKDAGAIDFNQMKSGAIQMAAPAAETYAIKDAAEKFGKLFGKDLNLDSEINYTDLLKKKIDVEELEMLYNLKQEQLSEDDQINAERIIKNKEVYSYQKLYKILKSK